MRRWLKLGVVVAVLALAAAACGGDGGGAGGSATPSGVKEGGILRVGSSGTVDSLNPFKATSQDAYVTFMYVYPTLVQYDADLNFVADFATSWDVAPDGTQITFTTASGGTWSDGQPLTAKDAAWTISEIITYRKSTAANMGGYVKHMASAEAPDDATLVITYDTPVNTDWALSQLNQIYVLPEHVWSPAAGPDAKDLKTFPNSAPIVSGGPFVLQKYVKNDYAQFVTNQGFYGEKPHIEGWALKWYDNDDAMITAFQSGELDQVTTIPPQTFEKLSANPNVVVAESPGLYFEDLIFNSMKPLHQEILDPKLREAFAHAIDMQKIVDTVLLGHGQVGSTIVPLATPKWHNAAIEQRAFDPATANQILDDLGFKMGSDGVRIANGHPMDYDVYMTTGTSSSGGDRAFEIMQQGLADVGVKINLKVLDYDTVWSTVTGTGGKGYDQFDLAYWNWIPLPDPDFILSVMTCRLLGSWSDTGYCNKEYDKLYDEQGRTVDTAGRKEIVDQMQQIIFEDSPYIVVQYVNWLEAHSKNWDGLIMSPQGSINSLTKISLEQVHQVG